MNFYIFSVKLQLLFFSGSVTIIAFSISVIIKLICFTFPPVILLFQLQLVNLNNTDSRELPN